MTDAQFLRECARYFGPWPVDKPGVLEAVAEYVKHTHEDVLEALWPLVRDYRPRDWSGPMPPPDMSVLKMHIHRASETARLRRPLIDDGGYLPMAEARIELAKALKRALDGKTGSRNEGAT